MLLINGGKKHGEGYDRDREYRERERDYERRPERMGMERHMDYEPESRFRDRRGREHYDDGRYAPARSEYEDAYSGGYRHMGYPSSPYVPPVYEGMESRMMPYSRMDSDRDMDREPRPRNKIGFAIEGEMDRLPDESYHHTAGSARHMDGEPMHFTRESAMAWTGDMINADGTKGPHWSMEQVKKVMDQRGIDADPLQFYAILNAVYSDYCAVAKRHGVGDKIDFYVDMARAWLDDPDADKDKAARYFEYIVKH